jgi:hypothetical protein
MLPLCTMCHVHVHVCNMHAHDAHMQACQTCMCMCDMRSMCVCMHKRM